MARSVNKAILIGNMAADPDLRYTQSGTPVCSFRIITNESYKDSSGEWVERAEGHNIVAWSRLAEICAEYLKKGGQVYIEGPIQTRSYEQDGVTKYVTEITAREMLMLGGRDSGSYERSGPPSRPGNSPSTRPKPQGPAPGGTSDDDSAFDLDEDDLPF